MKRVGELLAASPLPRLEARLLLMRAGGLTRTQVTAYPELELAPDRRDLFLRLQAVGLAHGNSCEFPLTQEHLADAVGLTSVHVNRSLMELRAHGLIVLANRTLTIPDPEPLMNVALFDPAYLHFER